MEFTQYIRWLKEITMGIKQCLEINENENTTYPNLRDAAKVMLRDKSIIVHCYIKKTEINNLTLHLKKREK